ncbi:exodeoxyribonuclease III [Parvibaculum sp.]|jgi:exodeoxyribonuclease-3|uniref:exodeoxyribonuclease III n=1 Tax=Parvibaculum sp. TaxID=2024848 RepID=UPI001B133185|nr:exodeoxyribonuclease III [Parvibaculum sp.]MBO6635482.1 exodeoxyribonuclease III [Parvibaculum sp.]MBO6679063.1 exodeoxyribonuclease III [Parvibaculum sp.]MBO6684970.1 exodeoxyribonuclease III [Parvibaculum sp.]MBO6903788.1 exodeoxyribonuclease III [Parvibaculum sp.]
MKIASFNVNSIKARLANLTDWLKEATPDVVCLQELKCQDEAFPRSEIEDLGYNVATHGQKTYNGVAILSKPPLEDVSRGLPGGNGDEQSRYIEAVVTAGDEALRVASIYLPNGNPVDSEKFEYKLHWMDRLIDHSGKLLAYEEPLVLAGDFNVIPTADDVHDPKAWADDALFRPETRAKFRELVNLGFTDAFRACHTEAHRYTFWDYQGGAWQKDNGIRIDHLLLSPQAADRLTASDIDRNVRGREKPSDHVPIWAELDIG